jgi:hypothetical protein
MGWRRLLLNVGTGSAVLLALGAGHAFAIPVVGGQLFSTGGNIQIEILPSDSSYTHELSVYSPELKDIGWSKDFGKVVDLGVIPYDTELVFGIYVNNTGDVFKMGSGSRNYDGVMHATVDFQSPGVAIVGFEDLYGGGDGDYNDCIFKLTGGIAPTPAPIPPALSLFAPGLIGLAAIRRRFKK